MGVVGEVRSGSERDAHRSQCWTVEIELGRSSGLHREDPQVLQTKLAKDFADSLGEWKKKNVGLLKRTGSVQLEQSSERDGGGLAYLNLQVLDLLRCSKSMLQASNLLKERISEL